MENDVDYLPKAAKGLLLWNGLQINGDPTQGPDLAHPEMRQPTQANANGAGKTKMMWYSASLYFESLHNPPTSSESIWDQRIILIEGVDEADAFSKATEYGKSEEHNYPNQAGEIVAWKFDSVDRLTLLDSDKLSHRLEVFSRFLKASDVTNLKKPFDD